MGSDLAGQVAMVTGAARGQGREMALEIARAGADIAICDIGAASMESVGYGLGGPLGDVADEIRALGRRAFGAACDVRDQTQVDGFVSGTLAALGQIDILVNNAGILSGNVALHEMEDVMWNTVLDVNLTGAWRMARAVVPHMIARGKGGRIVNIASVAGLVGTPLYGHYCASKHGLVGLTKTMAAELGQYSITVNAICPGLVDTPMVAHSTSVMAQQMGITQGEAYDIQLTPHIIKERISARQSAAAVMYLVSDAARVVTGSALQIDGGWSAL